MPHPSNPQIPSELIQLDPDCISKLKTTRTGGEGEGGEKGKAQSKNKVGGKSQALKRQKRIEEEGRVRVRFYCSLESCSSSLQVKRRKMVHSRLREQRRKCMDEHESSDEDSSCNEENAAETSSHVLDRFR